MNAVERYVEVPAAELLMDGLGASRDDVRLCQDCGEYVDDPHEHDRWHVERASQLALAPQLFDVSMLMARRGAGVVTVQHTGGLL